MTIEMMVSHLCWQGGMLEAIRASVKDKLIAVPEYGQLLMTQLTHAHPTPNPETNDQPARSVIPPPPSILHLLACQMSPRLPHISSHLSNPRKQYNLITNLCH